MTTREALLAAATELLQRVGYASFSFRDLAGIVGIRSASIHYHFPTKGDLGVALVEWYRVQTRERERELCERHPRVRTRLLALAEAIDEHTCSSGTKSCPLSNLQAEYAVLPEELQRAVKSLVDEKLAILAGWLEQGRRAGELRFPGRPQAQAHLLWSIIEHGTHHARSHPGHSLKALMRQFVHLMAP
jgi:TetR/AcrR family transcriptional regulator, transcriptional repressor for nem operon